MQKPLSVLQSNRIQILRGLAILAVVLIHSTPQGLTQVLCKPLLNFSVGLFLFLSGMLSDAQKWKPVKRIVKILIPYIIWTLIYVVIHDHKTPSQLPMLFLKKLVTADAAVMMYYVFVYCELTLLIPLIDKLARSKVKWLGFIISPIELLLISFLPKAIGFVPGPVLNAVRHVSWYIYFYLGYLLGNEIIELKFSTIKISVLWLLSLGLQIAEGYWFMTLGDTNAGTQSKLSAMITTLLFLLLTYRYIYSEKAPESRILKALGDASFGIFFSHLAIMTVLNKIPHYTKIAIYPLNAIIAISLSFIYVIIGKKVLGKFAKYLAL